MQCVKRRVRLTYLMALCACQTVYSGEDFQSAAQTVLGYRRVSDKGKVVEVPPVQQVSSPKLQNLVDKVVVLTVSVMLRKLSCRHQYYCLQALI